MAKKFNCWHCKEVILDDSDIMIYKYNNVNRKFHKSFNCLNEFLSKKEMERKKQEEKSRINEGWIDLCEYIKKDILGYTNKMQISNHAMNSLRELRSGGFVRLNSEVTDNGYPYPIILMTFKVKKPDIDRALLVKDFNGDENKKFNYIMAIIKNSINDVYKRVLDKEKQDKMLKSRIETEVPKAAVKVEYIRKSEVNKKADLFDDIW